MVTLLKVCADDHCMSRVTPAVSPLFAAQWVVTLPSLAFVAGLLLASLEATAVAVSERFGGSGSSTKSCVAGALAARTMSRATRLRNAPVFPATTLYLPASAINVYLPLASLVAESAPAVMVAPATGFPEGSVTAPVKVPAGLFHASTSKIDGALFVWVNKIRMPFVWNA